MRNELKLYYQEIILSDNRAELLRQELDDLSLSKLHSLTEKTSAKVIFENYGTLLSLIFDKYSQHCAQKELFSKNYKSPPVSQPFIIGVSGSVACGKSTFARILQKLLRQNFTVANMTTDCFLHSTDYLKEHNLLHQKGFPISFNRVKIQEFIDSFFNKEQQFIKLPVYSHASYDLIDSVQILNKHSDILIIEGVNVLQNFGLTVELKDILNLSLFIDATDQDLEYWFLKRFKMIRQQAIGKPEKYFYRFTQMTDQAANDFALNVWQNINLKNFTDYILPSQQHADIILKKSRDHSTSQVFAKSTI